MSACNDPVAAYDNRSDRHFSFSSRPTSFGQCLFLKLFIRKWRHLFFFLVCGYKDT
jgi:hypothetical protein